MMHVALILCVCVCLCICVVRFFAHAYIIIGLWAAEYARK
jgi:hypothetical protein